jgi:hypothetical protein
MKKWTIYLLHARMMAQRFTPRHERWPRDSHPALNEGPEIHSRPWLIAPVIILATSWRDSPHAMNDGLKIHSMPWMMGRRFPPCHEWGHRDSHSAMNDGLEIYSAHEWWTRDSV